MPSARRPQALRGAVFRKRDVLAAGLLTTDSLRSPAWRRLYRGVYADADLPDSLGVRIRGARLLAPPSAVFSGRTAAFLHGATELADIADRSSSRYPRTSGSGRSTACGSAVWRFPSRTSW